MSKHHECEACREGCLMAHLGNARCNGDICQETERAILDAMPPRGVHPVGCICEACSVAYERQRAF